MEHTPKHDLVWYRQFFSFKLGFRDELNKSKDWLERCDKLHKDLLSFRQQKDVESVKNALFITLACFGVIVFLIGGLIALIVN